MSWFKSDNHDMVRVILLTREYTNGQVNKVTIHDHGRKLRQQNTEKPWFKLDWFLPDSVAEAKMVRAL